MTDKIRIRESGAVVSDSAFRIMHKETSFTAVLDAGVLDAFGADPVYDGLQPTLSENQYASYDGVEEIDGKWFTKYVAVDYTPEELAASLDAWRHSATVSPFQGRAALLHANLLEQVEAMMSQPGVDPKSKLAWQYALVWERTSQLIISLSEQLGLTDEQVDDLYRYGMTVTA